MWKLLPVIKNQREQDNWPIEKSCVLALPSFCKFHLTKGSAAHTHTAACLWSKGASLFLRCLSCVPSLPWQNSSFRPFSTRICPSGRTPGYHTGNCWPPCRFCVLRLQITADSERVVLTKEYMEKHHEGNKRWTYPFIRHFSASTYSSSLWLSLLRPANWMTVSACWTEAPNLVRPRPPPAKFK